MARALVRAASTLVSTLVRGVVLLATLALPIGAADDVPFELLHVHGNVYMLASTLGNVTIQVGKDPGHQGVLLVDTGAAAMSSKIAAEIRKLSPEPVRFIVNTSADPDHTGGNEAIAKPDTHVFGTPEAVTVFAQANVLVRMSEKGSGVATGAWPTITFEDRKALEFNGETVEVFTERDAHTDGDSIVLFRGSNVLSVGDVFLTTGYPVIDWKRGGSIQGELKALNHILELTVPHAMQEGGTMVIPGHGRLCDQADVTDYRDMMTIIRDRIADGIAKGKTLDQVKAMKPTRDYDRRYSTSSWTGDMLVEAIYETLK